MISRAAGLSLIAACLVLAGCDEAALSSREPETDSASERTQAPPRPSRRPPPPPAVYSQAPGSGSVAGPAQVEPWQVGCAIYDNGCGGRSQDAPRAVLASFGPKTVVFTAAARTLEAPAPPPAPRPADADPAWTARLTAYGDRLRREGGSRGLCYGAVKGLLKRFGVVSTFTGNARWRDGDGRPVLEDELLAAYQFPKWAANHPSLHGRRLRRVARPSWPPAIGNVVVYARGVCGFRDYGHIELVYRRSPDLTKAWAVSDHSREIDAVCFRREAERAPRSPDRLAVYEVVR